MEAFLNEFKNLLDEFLENAQKIIAKYQETPEPKPKIKIEPKTEMEPKPKLKITKIAKETRITKVTNDVIEIDGKKYPLEDDFGRKFVKINRTSKKPIYE